MIVLPDPAPGRGVYRYSLNGEPTGVEEYFVSEATAAGTAVRSERRAPGGVLITVTVDRLAQGADCVVAFASDGIGEVRATYALRSGVLEVGGGVLEVGDEADRGSSQRRKVTGDGVLSPLLRVFQGPAIAACLAADGPIDVVVPALDPGDPGTLLHPEVQQRSAERAGVESTATGILRHCRYMGGNYDDSADFWLDERDRLVRYRYPESADRVWDVTLVEG